MVAVIGQNRSERLFLIKENGLAGGVVYGLEPVCERY